MALSEMMQKKLEKYIDLDFIDQLSAEKRKKDGNYYTTYTAELLPEYATLAPDRGSVILKEISQAQVPIYQKLSNLWNPYIEAVFGVVEAEGQYLSINEFIQKPSCLVYSSPELAARRSLSLEDYINEYGCLSETEAIIFLIQLCRGLESIAALSLVHGDVAPQNILLTDRSSITPEPYMHIKGLHQRISCKLIDFDITSAFKNENHMVTVVAGTNPYAAPEILDYKNPTKRVDIYSLGCVLCFMITGKSPKQLSAKEQKTLCSFRVRNLIAKCTADYSKRYRNISVLRHHLERILAFHPLRRHHLVSQIPGLDSGRPLNTLLNATIYSALLLISFFVGYPDISLFASFSILSLIVVVIFSFLSIKKRIKFLNDFDERFPVFTTACKLIFLFFALLVIWEIHQKYRGSI